jgi:hypothetical protein
MVRIVALVALLDGILYGVVNYLTAKTLTKIVELVAEDMGSNFKDLQKSFNSLAEIVQDHHLALGFLLAEQGGVCAVVNVSCCNMLIPQLR